MSATLRRNAALLSVTSIAVGGFNYLLNLYLANRLTAADFGDASLIINLVLITSAAGATLQLVVARAVSAGEDLDAANRRFSRIASIGGLVLGFALIAGAGWLRTAFQASTAWLFVILGASMPLYLLQSIRRGIVQGALDMRRLAASFAAEAVARLAVAVLLIELGSGATGAVVAIGVSFGASLIAARPPRSSEEEHERTAGNEMQFAAATATLLCAQVMISSGDVVAAKYVLSPDAAGAYAALALVGRVPFFVTTAIANAAFPAAARSDATQRRTIAFETSVLVIIVGVASIAGLTVVGPTVLPLLLGPNLAIETSLAIRYVITTSCFSLAYILATIALATNRTWPTVVLAIGAGVQTALLFGASTPQRLVTVQMLVMVVCMLAASVAFVRSAAASNRAEAGGPFATSMSRT